MTFDIDVNGILKVSAKDLDTGRAQSITIDGNERMSDSEIEKAIRDAQQYASQDGIRREAVDVNNEAKQLINQVQYTMQEKKKEISREDRSFLKNDISALQKALDKNNPAKATQAEVQAVKTAIENLKQSSSRIL